MRVLKYYVENKALLETLVATAMDLSLDQLKLYIYFDV